MPLRDEPREAFGVREQGLFAPAFGPLHAVSSFGGVTLLQTATAADKLCSKSLWLLKVSAIFLALPS